MANFCPLLKGDVICAGVKEHGISWRFLGYSLYGKLENCPLGETCYCYRKDLAQGE